ncbi:hypothetical protein EUGRSUZ_A00754 [Eucalyptus grandis]|uniref:Uncharacterized protein n=2 Tax=Eucalyptus grandis TaxID=71139 RepID=A0ACC3M0T3_EUCGR|nr:hypothetical protein EUGRSUZ_A00754 [Eucalyptus grandis]
MHFTSKTWYTILHPKHVTHCSQVSDSKSRINQEAFYENISKRKRKRFTSQSTKGSWEGFYQPMVSKITNSLFQDKYMKIQIQET